MMNCRQCLEPFKLEEEDRLPIVLTMCGHTFCSTCVTSNMNLKQEVVCKDCHKTSFPSSDGKFPLNQTLISILKKNEQGLCEFLNESQVCKVHGKKLEAYCDNEKQCVCLSCILGDHKSHKIASIPQKVQKQKLILKACEQSLLQTTKSLRQKEQQCSRIIDRYQLDYQQYQFQINLLFKNIVISIQQSQENFTQLMRKSITSKVEKITTTRNLVKEKIKFYQDLDQILQALCSKEGIEFLQCHNQVLFLTENSIFKDKIQTSYKKSQIDKQAILSQTIKSLQDFLIFEKRKNLENLNQKQLNQGKNNSQNKHNQQKIKNNEKTVNLINRQQSFNQTINESPCQIQKKISNSEKNNLKQPQVLEINLIQKYEKHLQAKNMKKRYSQIETTKGKSPKIQYEVKREIEIAQTNHNQKYSSNGNYHQKKQIKGLKNQSEGKILTNSLKNMWDSKLEATVHQNFNLSFLNQSQILASPQRIQKPINGLEMSTPFSIHSFMQSSQCTVFHDHKQDTLKNSLTSFSLFSLQQKIYHFGGLKNDTISYQKISTNNQNITLSNQTCLQGFLRSKSQCVYLKSYHPKKLLIIGGKDQNSQKSKTIFSYDFSTNQIQKCYFELNQPASGFGAIAYNDKLYVFGGSSFSALKTLHQYTVNKNSFAVKKLTSMINSRDQLGFTLGSDGYLYVGGGINSTNNILNSCERYCFKSNKWSSISAMRHPRRSFSMVSLPNGVFAIGGHNGKSFLRSVQLYDFDTQAWAQVAPMNQGRFTHTAVGTNDCQNIIVFGGFQNQPLRSVQAYNVIENKWYLINEMNQERFLHCSILMRD